MRKYRILVVDDEEVEIETTTEEAPIDEDYYDAYTLEEDASGTDFVAEDNFNETTTLEETATTTADVTATEDAAAEGVVTEE